MQRLNFSLLSEQYHWYANDIYNLLDCLDLRGLEGKVWLAGGAVRRAILNQPTIGVSDFDFFFADETAFLEFEKRLVEKKAKKLNENERNTTYEYVVCPKLEDGDKKPTNFKIQLIRVSYYSNLEAVLDSFDFTLCQVGLDFPTMTLWAADMALYDIGRKHLVVNKITFPIASLRRIIKYTSQGFYACQGCLESFLDVIAKNPALLLNNAQYVD